MEPRKHAELSAQFMADKTLLCWVWWTHENKWVGDGTPMWHPDSIYHVGHTAPTDHPVKMCVLAGVEFPMPLREAKDGQIVWPVCHDPDSTIFNSDDLDHVYGLVNGLLQPTEAGARQQWAAMCKVLAGAIEGVK